MQQMTRSEFVEELLFEVSQQISPKSSKSLFIGFDRDGTLVPYANRPEDAEMSESVSRLLVELGNVDGVTLSIVSARSIAFLLSDLQSVPMVLAGNYGLEIQIPGKPLHVNESARQAVANLEQVRDRLLVLCDPETKAIVEDHGFSVCLHWQNVPFERLPSVEAAVKQVSTDFPQLEFVVQPTSYEFLPAVRWDKGLALQLIDEMTAVDGEERFYMFFGDSDADEFPIRWANDRGGIGVRVGPRVTHTDSKFQLPEPRDVETFLVGLLKLLNSG